MEVPGTRDPDAASAPPPNGPQGEGLRRTVPDPAAGGGNSAAPAPSAPITFCPDAAAPTVAAAVDTLSQGGFERTAPAEPAGAPRATDATAPTPVLPVRAFGRYRLLAELGRGGMGVVWKAWDPQLQRTVALKQILPGAGVDAARIERFAREARLAAQLRHPGIVGVHDVGVQDGAPYFTSDFIEGRSLEARMKERVPLEHALACVAAVARALAHAHEAGIVHRDVKPANILLDTADHPHVTDFGLAKEVAPETHGAAAGPAPLHLTRSGAVVGTPHYMSPEQARGQGAALGPASDQFSLGIVLYELLTGRLPFHGSELIGLLRAIAERDPIPPRRHEPRLPADAETICLKALEKDPARRFASCTDLADDLERCLRREPICARPIPPALRLARATLRHPAILLPCLAAVLLLIGLAAHLASARRASEVGRVLARAEGLWREAKSVLYSPGMPIARYHEKLAEALRQYDAAIAIDAGDGWIYESRGRVRIQVNDLAGAEADLEKAVRLLGPERGRAARRSLGRVCLERSIGLLSASSPAERQARRERANEWRERALRELEASAGDIEWHGTQDEGEKARRLAEGLAAAMRGDEAGAGRLFLAGVERAADEDCAWAKAVTGPEGEKERWLETALSLRPRFARALVERGQCRRDRGDLDAAIADFAEAIGIDPGYAAAWVGRGTARVDRGELPQARSDFDCAIRLEPGLIAGYVNRGHVRHALGDLPGALADLAVALRLDPTYAPTYVIRGTARADTDFPAALQDFADALRYCPGYAPALVNRGLARAKHGEPEGARRDLDEAVRNRPDWELVWLDRGTLRIDAGDWEGAIADFSEAIRLAPDRAGGWINRGTTRLAQGDLPGARADYDEAVRVDPKSSVARYNRGHLRAETGDPAGALADYDEAVRLDPRYTEARVNRGALKEQAGDARGALLDYDDAVRIDPHHLQARKNRASARRAAGNHAGELEDRDEVVRLEPGAAMNWVARAVAREDAGDVGGATADCDRAIALAPGDAALYEARAIVREKGGDHAGALADFGEAIRLDPKDGHAYANRGMTRLAAGDRAQARADFEQALELGGLEAGFRKQVEEGLRQAKGE